MSVSCLGEGGGEEGKRWMSNGFMCKELDLADGGNSKQLHG